MQDNSGLRAGDITNGAHSRNTSSSKKESSSSKSSGGFSEMFRQAFAALKEAETAAKADEKKQAAADKLVDKFVQNFRDADGDTQLKIAENLKRQNLKDILRPEIQRPEIMRPQFAAPLQAKQADQSNNGDTNGDGKNAWAELFRNAMQKVKEAEDAEGAENSTRNEPGTIGTANGSDVVDYTYAPGDTFGQVLIKMGLSDGRNLWGPNGDVEYYRKQLHDQGLYGNIPIGRTIRLRRRK